MGSNGRKYEETCITGWWFGTCVIFTYMGKNHPNCLIFFRGVGCPQPEKYRKNRTKAASQRAQARGVAAPVVPKEVEAGIFLVHWKRIGHGHGVFRDILWELFRMMLLSFLNMLD